MTVIPAGSEVPAFTLKREDGSDFTEADLQGTTTILVFYPFAFSPVCTDQMQIYNEALPEIADKGAVIYGVSTDPAFSQAAFREKLGIEIPQLSDFEPKGEACRVFGAYYEPGGMSNRALVIVGPDGRVAWSHLAGTPADLPGLDLIFEGLKAA